MASENLVNSILVHSNSFFVHVWHTSSVAYNFFPNAAPGQDTRSTTQFNLPPSDCRCHFNFVSVVNGSTQGALGFKWRGIGYTFSSS